MLRKFFKNGRPVPISLWEQLEHLLVVAKYWLPCEDPFASPFAFALAVIFLFGPNLINWDVGTMFQDTVPTLFLSSLDPCLISIMKNSCTFLFADRAYSFFEKFFEMSWTFQTGSKPVWSWFWTVWSWFWTGLKPGFWTQKYMFEVLTKQPVLCDNKQTLNLFLEGDQTRVQES